MFLTRTTTRRARVPVVHLAASVLLLMMWTSGIASTVESAEEGMIYKTCSTAEYSNGSEYHRNLEALVKALREEAGRTGFSATVYGGKKANRVWGRLQCRGDLSPADCAACSAETVKNIPGPYCNNPVSATVQLEHCFLRYQNSNFLSHLDTNEEANAIKDSNQTADTNFSDMVSSLLLDLSRKSAASPIKFAMGSSFVASSNVTIYGMEMCWRDMSTKDCKACLSKGVGHISKSFSQYPSVQEFFGSCTLRYETYDFAKHY